jgi:hypothetical protein
MVKHSVTLIGFALAVAFVVLFFHGRSVTRELVEVAPRVGMSYDELNALGPRISARTGVTLGSSRRVVFLLVCSGQANKVTLEAQAEQAGTLARERRLSDREAVHAVLTQSGGSIGALKDC